MSASIRDQGIIVPIVIWFWESKWWLLDGRNRVLCAKAVSYRFKPTDFKVFVGDLREKKMGKDTVIGDLAEVG
jgi:hypothetical protein